MKLTKAFFEDIRALIQSAHTTVAKGVDLVQVHTNFEIGRRIVEWPFTLSWTHHVFLLGIKNPDERGFYEIEATTQNWTVRELKRQFDTSLYERLALSRDKKGVRRLARKGHVVTKPSDLFKEPLVLEFLGLDEHLGRS